MRMLLLTILFAAPALARPPATPPYMRMDDLGPKLADLNAKLRKAELFASKIRQERMILRFERGDEEFENKKFSDRSFVEEILVKWQAVQKPEEECEADHLRILALLPRALKARYDIFPVPKAERYQASKVLVKALKIKHFVIRRAAILCLDAIYRRTLMYRADAPSGQRNDRYRKWLKEIDRLRK